MEEKEKLPIPVNVPEQKDFLPGIGSKELGIIAVLSMIDIVLIFIIHGVSGSLITSILIGAIIIALVVMVVKRDRFNECVIDKVKIVFQFSEKQKKYVYSFYDMYRCESNQRGEE